VKPWTSTGTARSGICKSSLIDFDRRRFVVYPPAALTDPDPDDDAQLTPPRPGAHCADHPDREAAVRCVMCDRDVCFSCFFADLDRCQRCVEQHPEEVTDPIPFETRGMIRGFFPTIASAFSPRHSAPAFGIGDSIARPTIFLLMTFVPIALLRGVIPYTHRMQFGPLAHVTFTAGSTTRSLAVDAIRAAGLSLLECSLYLVAFGLCFVSLAGAFGRDGAKRIAIRALFYRAFLLPLGGLGLLVALTAWLGPPALGSAEVVYVLGALPLVLFTMALQRSVRSVGRVDLVPGLLVVVVPWILVTGVAYFTLRAMLPVLPAGFVE